MDPRATEGKAELARTFQDVSTVVDASGLCIFLTFGTTLESIRPILEATTGVACSDAELLAAGERIWNLERVWNLKAGITAADDTLPKRMLEEAIPAGPAAGEVSRLGEMLPEYYRVRGWSEDGEPTPEKLRELGLA
jgi:aldehyde:ferredoxin oxidoreductase